MAIQEDLTSVRVSWSPPTPLEDTTGYRIIYSGGSSGSVDVSDGSTSTHTLTGLVNGASYNISLVATSQHLSSGSMEAIVTLGETTHYFTVSLVGLYNYVHLCCRIHYMYNYRAHALSLCTSSLLCAFHNQ